MHLQFPVCAHHNKYNIIYLSVKVGILVRESVSRENWQECEFIW